MQICDDEVEKCPVEMDVDCESHLVAQCYDGANVMSGRLNGLKAILRK